MLTRKKVFAFFLILVMILLTGCSSSSRYPKDKTAMKKLFEDNAGEFQKFADNLLLQVEEGELLDIVYVPKANLGSVYGYTISKGTNSSALESISKLQNGKEVSDFFAKYSVFSAMAGGGSGTVTFDVFPIHLAESSGSGSGYKPEHMKDIRQFSYQPNATKEEISTILSSGSIVIQEYWYASIPGEVTDPNSNLQRTLDETKNQLLAFGYKEITPVITSINLPFLSNREKASNTDNSYADYIFEIDETHMLFFFEREKKVSATLLNWETEEIVENYIFPVEASQSGIYHVERLSLDLFAYSVATLSGESQSINILRIAPEKIEEVGFVTLPSDVKFTVCSAGISPDMKQIIMARTEPARLTLAELDGSLVIHETGELNATTLMIGDRATIDNVKFISEDVVAYSWTANNTDEAARYSGIGLYSIKEGEILLDYPISLKKFLVVKDGLLFHNSDFTTKDYNNRFRFITPSEVYTFGEELFFYNSNSVFYSSMGDQIFSRVQGTSKHLENISYVRYSLTDNEWDQDIWNIPDPVVLRNAPPKTRSIYIATASTNEKRFYILALDGQKPILNVVQHPNP